MYSGCRLTQHERRLSDLGGEVPRRWRGATTPRSPFARSTASHSLVANNRVRLEDLVTEHELSDSSEIVARRVAGYLDLGAMIALPLCYMIVVIVYFNRFGAMMAEEEFENTKVVHVAPEDF